ncbi:copper resistance protein B [Marinospirillum perlucidum]|uniref:copper resistance protein B n=1 Tax=Marinospirillum perlucidum TaxID=1982602 RepID=UPI000DF2A1E4|nr:copper resistance protein B [Marinospirillum perlucidum]
MKPWHKIGSVVLTGWLLSSPVQAMSGGHFWGVSFEELEYRTGDEDLLAWNGDLYYGSDELTFRWQPSGEYVLEESQYASLQNNLVVQKPVSGFFDVKAGVRLDTPEGEDRNYVLFGVTGLAPQWIEMDANFYWSDNSKASADLDLEYEILLTNYWVLSAAMDVKVGFHEDLEIGQAKGLNATELGFRLSRDLLGRTLSPYVGVVNERLYGDRKDWAEAAGSEPSEWFAVIGARLMF